MMHRQGTMDRFFLYLEERRNRALRPEAPVGVDWPYMRAFKDGMAKESDDLLIVLKNMIKLSPDGAENTED